jgi:hypothetical protein
MRGGRRRDLAEIPEAQVSASVIMQHDVLHDQRAPHQR